MEYPLEKENNKTSLADPVYEYLKKMILNLEFSEGEKIIESKISKSFGVSRTPVRDALRRLSNDGLIKIFPNKVAKVVTFDREHIQNMGIARLSLDTISIKLAIYYGSNSDFAKLETIAKECLEASKQGDLFLQNNLDVKFHREISKISRNPFIEKFMGEIFLQLELLLNIIKINLGQADKKTHEIHFELVNSLMARDQTKAVETIKKHLYSFYGFDDTLTKLLKTD